MEEDAVAADAALVARIGAGDRQALRELYGRYAPPLFSLAVRLVGDGGEAEELLQDAFVKIWKHAGRYDPRKSRPFTWAVTILRRGCIDALRRRRRHPAAAPWPEEEPATPAPTAAEAAAAGDDADRLRSALAALPADARRALELALFSGLTQTEIAARLRQPLGTVKSWIRRGLLGLRTTLSDPA